MASPPQSAQRPPESPPTPIGDDDNELLGPVLVRLASLAGELLARKCQRTRVGSEDTDDDYDPGSDDESNDSDSSDAPGVHDVPEVLLDLMDLDVPPASSKPSDLESTLKVLGAPILSGEVDWSEVLYSASGGTLELQQEIRDASSTKMDPVAFVEDVDRPSWHTHCDDMDTLWNQFISDIRPLVGDDYDLSTLVKPSGAIGAVLHIQWRYPTFSTKKTNI
ncbi:hypothetical protein TgHK011_007158 [Trichoderma gracile]|nr:hypothetical protein TgHK011_007158 [Trichoderma gracile]